MNAVQILKTYFGYDSFRKGQEEMIDAVLSGRDAMAIMPTGAGKSICYQVPALLLPGITLVISPLISLMQDQVKSLNEAGIHAAFINSTLTEIQIERTLNLALQGIYKILYVAPERLESVWFMDFALQADISMVTIDEAHCISQWGQDFRPSYRKIVDFIDRLPVRPTVSTFTATATAEVKTDIECILKLDHPKVVMTGFDRENLYYSVKHLSEKQKGAFVMDYMQKHPNDSGIIYCATRKKVDMLCEALVGKGILATSYHAGLTGEVRKAHQEDFIYDRVPVVVATNAFGMGIDKSNVRFVIHYNMPQSMENYYQEAGRAGRDGEAAQCILLYSPQDVIINKFLLGKKEFEGIDEADIELLRQRDAARLRTMTGYGTTTSCLRRYILEYFGEKADSSCSNCGNCHNEYTEVDMTADAKWMINCIAETKGRYGQRIVTGILLGSNRARLKEIGAASYKSFGKLSHRSESELRILLDQLLAEGYVIQTDDEYSVLRMGDITRLKEENARVTVRKLIKEDHPARTKKEQKRKTDVLTSAGFELFEKLRCLRLVIAKEEGMPPYIVFNDRTLVDMCVKAPRDRQGMLAVSGVAEHKYQKYGQRFVDEITGFLADRPGVVLSIQTKEEANEPVSPEKKQKRGKGRFYLNPEDADQFEYDEYYFISDIQRRLNTICSAENTKAVTTKDIWNCLLIAGLVIEEERENSIVKGLTKKGREEGIRILERVSQAGMPYRVLQYPENVQKMIVESFVGPREEQILEGSGKETGQIKMNVGAPWTMEEDEQLKAEFQSGMKIQDIANKHGRTKGAISSRLRKFELIR